MWDGQEKKATIDRFPSALNRNGSLDDRKRGCLPKIIFTRQATMRLFVVFLGIVGMIPPGILGISLERDSAKWGKFHQYVQAQVEGHGGGHDPKLEQAINYLNRFRQTIWLLFAAVPVGFLASMLVYFRRTVFGGSLMIFAGLIPVVWAPDLYSGITILAFCSLLIIGGILAFFVKPKQTQPPQEKVG